MQRAQSIPDKQLLFKKLFISPSCNEPLDPPLLLSPDFVTLLLEQSSTAKESQQLTLLDEILNIFAQRPMNSLMLSLHDQGKIDSHKFVADAIVGRLLKLVDSEEQIDLYIERLKLMFAYYRINLQNICTLTQDLSKTLFLEKFSEFKFLFICKLLALYYGPKLGEKKSPENYIYFPMPTSGIDIVIENSPSNHLKGGDLSVLLSFSTQFYTNSWAQKPKKEQILVQIKTVLKEEITLCIDNNFLTLSGNKEKLKGPQIQNQLWNKVGLTLTNDRTQIYVNGNIIKGPPLINKNKDRKISSIIMGKMFTGMIGNIVISNKIFSFDKSPLIDMKYGVDSFEEMNSLMKQNPIIFSLLPFCQPIGMNNQLTDMFSGKKMQIKDNVFIINKSIHNRNITNEFGFKILLGMFYISRFYASGYGALSQLLKAIYDIVTRIQPQRKEKNKKEELKDRISPDSWSIFGQLIADLENHYTPNVLDMLLTIYTHLSKEQKAIYLRDVLLSLKITSETEQSLYTHHFKNLHKILSSEPQVFQKSISFESLIYWLIHNVQTLQSHSTHISSQRSSFYCCVRHYLNETIISEINPREICKIKELAVENYYQQIEKIISDYFILATKNLSIEATCENFKVLLRLTLQKYSSCFYLMVLRVVKNVIQKIPKQKISKIFDDPQFQFISFLAFLSEKTINPDILTNIVYLTLLYGKINEKKHQDSAKFIVSLLLVNQQIDKKNVNPFKKLSLKIHRNSSIFPGSLVQTINKPRSNSLPCRQSSRQLIWKNTSSRLTSIEKLPKIQKLRNYPPFYNLMINQLSGNISTQQPKQSPLKGNQSSLIILKEYYSLAHSVYRQTILLHLLSALQENPQLRNNGSLIYFLLQSLSISIKNCQEELRNLQTIFANIFSLIISSKSSLLEYYSKLKFMKKSRASVSFILPFVLSKVIKLADMSQLFELMLIAYYELSCKEESSLTVAQMVLTQITDRVNKSYKQFYQNLRQGINENGNSSPTTSPQHLLFIQHSELFTEIVCEGEVDDKNLIDPFQEGTNQNLVHMVEIEKKKDSLLVSQQSDKFQLSEVKNQTVGEIKQSSVQTIIQPKPKEKGSQNVKNFLFVRKITALQMYIKLFFEFKEKATELSSNKSLPQPPSKPLRKSSQLSCALELKSPDQLSSSLLAIMQTYLKQSMLNLNCDKKYEKFILSYFLFLAIETQDCKHMFTHIVDFVLTEGLIKYVDNDCTKLEHIAQNMRDKGIRTTFLAYFTKNVFQYKVEDFKNWKNNRELLLQEIEERMQENIFNLNPHLHNFLNELEEKHDLLIISTHQKSMQQRAEDHEELVSQYSGEKSYKNINKLFDSENAKEEKTRISYLYDTECRFRKSHFLWDKLWKQMRIYNKPYGFWMAQKNKENVFQYDKKDIRNFKFEMSEYSGLSGMYPILEAKIIEPWTIIKDNKTKKNYYINSFSEIMKPNQIQVQESVNNGNILSNVWKGFIGLSKRTFSLPTKEKIPEFQVVLISRSTKALGKLFIQNKQYLVFCYEGARQDDTHLSFQKFSLPYNRETYHKWSIYFIKKIRIHRYLLRYNALEFMFINGKSIIFDFIKCDKEKFIKQIEKIQTQKLSLNPIKLYRMNRVPLFLDNFFEEKGIDPKITQRWVKREISNLQYLIKINRAASRGIYDLSQYMVMPWIAQFKKQKEPKLRDLTKTMGGLGSEQRKNIIREKYFTKDPFNPYPPFFFGTHYSSPGVVFNFLIRLSPFTEYCKNLQGGKFDIPDRLFSSLISAWRSASEEVSDIRQLIPQLYYLPEMFLNVDRNYFGFTQNNQLVDQVELPLWAANNAYFFTWQHRMLLESEEVSQTISDWIDLIFGYKQKGKNAEESFNVYYYLTYEDYIDIDQDEDDVYIKSKQAQIVHFGQIPPQLFDKEHPKRNPIPQLYQLKISRTITLMSKLKQKPVGMFINPLGTELYILKNNELQMHAISSSPAMLQKKKKINLQKSEDQSCYIATKPNEYLNTFFLKNHPYFIVYGFITNELRIYDRNSAQVNESAVLESRITSLWVSHSEDLILIGLDTGTLVVYEIQFGVTDIWIHRIATQFFTAPVVDINEFDGFFSICYGTYCSIYRVSRTLLYLTPGVPQSCEIVFFRSFVSNLQIKRSFICKCPLYCIVLIDNSNIRCYSINGQFIKSVACSGSLYGRLEDNSNNDIIYAMDEDKIVGFSVPDLRNVTMLEFTDVDWIFDRLVGLNGDIFEISYGVE